MLGAIIFFVCGFGGYIASIVLAGYVLLAEENIWLRKSAVKAVLLMVTFSIISTVVYFIPQIMTIINDVFEIFGGSFYPVFIYSLADIMQIVVSIVESILFIVLGLKAFDQGTLKVPLIDSIVNAYMS